MPLVLNLGFVDPGVSHRPGNEPSLGGEGHPRSELGIRCSVHEGTGRAGTAALPSSSPRSAAPPFSDLPRRGTKEHSCGAEDES